MTIYLYKTSIPSTRNGAVDNQVKSNPHNNLIYGQRCCGKGRNARGIITTRHRGRCHRRLYRKIDFRMNEKDYGDGEKRYVLYLRGAIIGDIIFFQYRSSYKMGNVLPLTDMPLGIAIHNIEITLGDGAQLARAPGAVAKLITKEGKSVTLKLITFWGYPFDIQKLLSNS
ncbi:hypothetical protein Cgig2_003276 [Carnegiea gigantea]|uniref:Ribosomal protein L2 n=1 Tax=Carnegiea gigantea TaxID=171969 RepID=A0A9Q1JIJ8_9CARY|nr:hypothetical protein Cgig2_003276 [Carnegiea gigantea]